MLVQNIDSRNSFSGKLSEKTLKMAYDVLGNDGYKNAKKFRAGKNKHDKITLIYDTIPRRTMYHGEVSQTDTYIEIANHTRKKPPLRVFLASGKLPFNNDLLELISKKMTIIDKLNK